MTAHTMQQEEEFLNFLESNPEALALYNMVLSDDIEVCHTHSISGLPTNSARKAGRSVSVSQFKSPTSAKLLPIGKSPKKSTSVTNVLGRSPAKQIHPIGKSPSKPGISIGRSPGKPAHSIGKSPAKYIPPLPVGKSPMQNTSRKNSRHDLMLDLKFKENEEDKKNYNPLALKSPLANISNRLHNDEIDDERPKSARGRKEKRSHKKENRESEKKLRKSSKSSKKKPGQAVPPGPPPPPFIPAPPPADAIAEYVASLAIYSPISKSYDIATITKNITDVTNGLDLKNHTIRQRTFKSAFFGSEILNWMLSSRSATNKRDADEICRILYEKGFIEVFYAKDKNVKGPYTIEPKTLYCFGDVGRCLLEDSLLMYFGMVFDVSNGVEIKDRMWYLKKVKGTFIGEEFVDWFLRENLTQDRAVALKVGKFFIDNSLVENATQESSFKDNQSLYQLTRRGTLMRMECSSNHEKQRKFLRKNNPSFVLLARSPTADRHHLYTFESDKENHNEQEPRSSLLEVSSQRKSRLLLSHPSISSFEEEEENVKEKLFIASDASLTEKQKKDKQTNSMELQQNTEPEINNKPLQSEKIQNEVQYSDPPQPVNETQNTQPVEIEIKTDLDPPEEPTEMSTSDLIKSMHSKLKLNFQPRFPSTAPTTISQIKATTISTSPSTSTVKSVDNSGTSISHISRPKGPAQRRLPTKYTNQTTQSNQNTELPIQNLTPQTEVEIQTTVPPNSNLKQELSQDRPIESTNEKGQNPIEDKKHDRKSRPTRVKSRRRSNSSKNSKKSKGSRTPRDTPTSHLTSDSKTANTSYSLPTTPRTDPPIPIDKSYSESMDTSCDFFLENLDFCYAVSMFKVNFPGITTIERREEIIKILDKFLGGKTRAKLNISIINPSLVDEVFQVVDSPTPIKMDVFDKLLNEISEILNASALKKTDSLSGSEMNAENPPVLSQSDSLPKAPFYQPPLPPIPVQSPRTPIPPLSLTSLPPNTLSSSSNPGSSTTPRRRAANFSSEKKKIAFAETQPENKSFWIRVTARDPVTNLVLGRTWKEHVFRFDQKNFKFLCYDMEGTGVSEFDIDLSKLNPKDLSESEQLSEPENNKYAWAISSLRLLFASSTLEERTGWLTFLNEKLFQYKLKMEQEVHRKASQRTLIVEQSSQYLSPHQHMDLSESISMESSREYSIVLRRYNKKGGVRVPITDTIQELLIIASEKMGFKVAKIREVETEAEIPDVTLLKPQMVVWAMTEEEELEFM